ncbi:hypothetical protein [Taklimakanibacter deserti]|uniref:hypothetical protein n=1 Tax=Taklimakanibacter deserti TaxID=2267839 RepID=UPI000E65C2C1
MVETRNLSQYIEIHAAGKRYHDGRISNHKLLAPWVFLRRPRSILDYGSGKNRMVERFIAPGASIRHRFDPAVPEIATIPLPRYDLILNTDVLEHLDEDEIGTVLADIHSHCKDALFLVDTRQAKTILPNGENAHATVRPAEWWLGRIGELFPDAELITVSSGKAYIRTWKASSLSKAVAPVLGMGLRAAYSPK